MPESPSAACFGKLPSHGDFVRHRAGGAGVQALDAWLQRGVLHAQQRLGRGLDAAFDAAGPTCFLIDPPAGAHVLAGALQPSRDRVGRRYPFLVAVEVERRRVDGRRIPAWPARYDAFFAEAAATVSEAVEGRLEGEALPQRLQRLHALFEDTPFLVDYQHRLHDAKAWALWTRTWGSPEDGRKYVLLKNLAEVFAAARGQTPRLPLRFPLAPAPERLDVSFWLEACWRLAPRPPEQLALFWAAPREGEAPERAALFVAAEAPPPPLLAHLLAQDGEPDGSFRLDDADGRPTAEAALALPARLGSLLEDPALSLRAFIERL